MTDYKKIAIIVALGIVFLLLLFWLSYFVQCYERKDMTTGDKILWTFILLIPILGIILYRGLGMEWKKRHSVVS